MSLSSIPPKYQCDLKFDYNIDINGYHDEILQIQTVQIVSMGQKWWDACVIYAKNHNVAKDSFVWHAASIILIGLQWSLKYYIGCLTPKFRIFSVQKYYKNILLFGEKVERLPKKGNFEQKYDCWESWQSQAPSLKQDHFQYDQTSLSVLECSTFWSQTWKRLTL